MPWDDEDAVVEDVVESLDNPYLCPICNSEDCVPAYYGTADTDVLLVGEEPGREEIIHGKPFVGPTGKLLQAELKRYKLRLRSFRLCNLWIHPSNKNDDCFERSVKLVLKEAKGKRLVVLIGSDTVKYFTGEKVSKWNGLLVHSPLLNNPYVMAMVQPATAFRSSIGEMRFALERLAYYATLEEEIK